MLNRAAAGFVLEGGRYQRGQLLISTIVAVQQKWLQYRDVRQLF